MQLPETDCLTRPQTFPFSALVGLRFVSLPGLTKVSVCGRTVLKQTSYWKFVNKKKDKKRKKERKRKVFPNWDPTWNRPATIRKL